MKIPSWGDEDAFVNRWRYLQWPMKMPSSESGYFAHYKTFSTYVLIWHSRHITLRHQTKNGRNTMELKKVFVLMLAVNLFYTMLVFMILVAKVVPEEDRWVRLLTFEEIFCPWKTPKQKKYEAKKNPWVVGGWPKGSLALLQGYFGFSPWRHTGIGLSSVEHRLVAQRAVIFLVAQSFHLSRRNLFDSEARPSLITHMNRQVETGNPRDVAPSQKISLFYSKEVLVECFGSTIRRLFLYGM